MWPKSTVEGVRSAVSSRKVMSKTIKFNFQRVNEVAGECESELVQEFELSLSRPMGIHIEGTFEISLFDHCILFKCFDLY